MIRAHVGGQYFFLASSWALIYRKLRRMRLQLGLIIAPEWSNEVLAWLNEVLAWLFLTPPEIGVSLG